MLLKEPLRALDMSSNLFYMLAVGHAAAVSSRCFKAYLHGLVVESWPDETYERSHNKGTTYGLVILATQREYLGTNTALMSYNTLHISTCINKLPKYCYTNIFIFSLLVLFLRHFTKLIYIKMDT